MVKVFALSCKQFIAANFRYTHKKSADKTLLSVLEVLGYHATKQMSKAHAVRRERQCFTLGSFFEIS